MTFEPETYLKCFETLVRVSLGPQTLKFMTCVSNALKEECQFSVLKLIYEKFIFDKLARFYKFTTTAQTEIQNLVSTYVFGFMTKVEVNPESVKYLLTDFRLLSKKHMSFWLELAVIIAYENPQVERTIAPIIQQITPMKTLQEIYSDLLYEQRKREAWIFIQKDLKDKKRYKLNSSSKAGIIN